MDRLDAMNHFVRVAELGSFSAVAQQLGVARSVVTRQVAALEAHLGIKLIARSTRSLALTPAGADYLEKCRVILNLVETAESGVAAQRHAPRGPVHLSVPLIYGRQHLTRHLLEFARRYPEVSLDIDYIDRRSKLIEEGIDLTVRITRRLQPGDVTRRVGRSDMVVIAAASYLDRHGEPRHPGELIHHECLAYSVSASPNSWEFDIEGRPQSFPIRSRLQLNNGAALVQAAAAGFGLAMIPRFIAAEALTTGEVRAVLGEFPLAELGIYLVLPGNRHVPHRVRVLMDFLAERLGEQPSWEGQAAAAGGTVEP